MGNLTDFRKEQILKSFGIEISDPIEKAVQPGLVAKKVQVTRKDGSIHYAIRYVSSETGKAQRVVHSKYRDEDDLHGDSDSDKIQNIVNSDAKPLDKVRLLASLGIYDKQQLADLSGHKYPADIPGLLRKEAGLDTKELDNPNAKLPTVSTSTPQGDLTDPTVQKMAISQIEAQLGSKAAFSAQEDLRVELAKQFGVTVKDKWNSYESRLNRLIKDGFPKAVMAYGTGGVGKAQPLYSKILTPEGFIQMSEAKIGQLVTCPDGSISNIVGVFPQKGLRKVYELTFIDGSRVRCDEEHLWKVKCRQNYTWKIVPLSYIIDKGIKVRNEWRFGVPFPSPIQYSEKQFKIHPYLLGYILGDGGLTVPSSISISVGDRDKDFILDKLNNLLEDSQELVYRSQYDWAIVGKQRYERSEFKKYLRESGLEGTSCSTKFVPKEYLQGSTHQRLELIQGLMDSDGFVDKTGTCTFQVTSKQLALDFYDLVKSFGRFAKFEENSYNLDKGIGKMCYQVVFSMPREYCPVSLPFKTERFLRRKKNYQQALSIVDIVYIGEEKTQCISIDHPEHLYITDNYIVTHNTFTFEKLAEHHKLIEYDPELDMNKNSDEYDYIKIGGKIGSREMQRVMYEHSDKLIVFDDCDSMWNDDGLINVLKNVLDTSGDGKCQWAQRQPETQKGLGDEVPSRFKFEGRMLFITNLSKKQLSERGAAPIAESRASSIDLTMDMDQTIERLEEILPYIRIKNHKGVTIPLTDEDKTAGLEALNSVKAYARVDQLNTRTLGKILGEARDQRETRGEYNQRDLTVFALQEFGLV